MSVRDLNKTIIITDALTGQPYYQQDFDEFLNSHIAEDYLYYKLSDLLMNEHGAILCIGYKS